MGKNSPIWSDSDSSTLSTMLFLFLKITKYNRPTGRERSNIEVSLRTHAKHYAV